MHSLDDLIRDVGVDVEFLCSHFFAPIVDWTPDVSPFQNSQSVFLIFRPRATFPVLTFGMATHFKRQSG